MIGVMRREESREEEGGMMGGDGRKEGQQIWLVWEIWLLKLAVIGCIDGEY